MHMIRGSRLSTAESPNPLLLLLSHVLFLFLLDGQAPFESHWSNQWLTSVPVKVAPNGVVAMELDLG